MESPKSEYIEMFVDRANEATLQMFKSSNEFKTDYIVSDFMTNEEKLKDMDMLISFFEEKERYEDCNFLLTIKNEIQ